MCTYYLLAVILSMLDKVVVTTSRARLVQSWFWQLYVASSNQYLRQKNQVSSDARLPRATFTINRLHVSLLHHGV